MLLPLCDLQLVKMEWKHISVSVYLQKLELMLLSSVFLGKQVVILVMKKLLVCRTKCISLPIL